MSPFLLLPKLLIAGGSSFLGTLDLPPDVEMMNHTLAGEKIPSVQVVCRDRWGTPMLPNGKGGYSLISPISKKLIEQSLWIPPASGSRPLPTPIPSLAQTPLSPSAASSPAAPVSKPGTSSAATPTASPAK